jgi:hypothetical protein
MVWIAVGIAGKTLERGLTKMGKARKITSKTGRQMQDMEPDSYYDEKARAMLKKAKASPASQVESIARDKQDATTQGYHKLDEDE